MKKLTLLFVLIIGISSAQTSPLISIDAGTQVTADTDNYSLGIALGIINWNGDFGALGFITKTYGNKTLCAGRLTGLLMVNSWLATYMQGDLFVIHDAPPIYKMINGNRINVQYNTSRLEVSTGVGIKAGHLLLLTGIQSDDYDPIADNRRQPVFVTKLTYTINLRPLSKNTYPIHRKSIKPKGF